MVRAGASWSDVTRRKRAWMLSGLLALLAVGLFNCFLTPLVLIWMSGMGSQHGGPRSGKFPLRSTENTLSVKYVGFIYVGYFDLSIFF